LIAARRPKAVSKFVRAWKLLTGFAVRPLNAEACSSSLCIIPNARFSRVATDPPDPTRDVGTDAPDHTSAAARTIAAAASATAAAAELHDMSERAGDEAKGQQSNSAD